MKIVTVVGARPQFIKAAAVSRAIVGSATATEVLVHTGQHYDSNMSDVFFSELGIPAPRYHLGVHGGSHGAMTGQMLAKIEEVLQKESPDWVLVFGDTNSTLAAALAASKMHIPIAHVEAGLRSYNRRMPEEVNRVLTDHISHLLFAPTESSVQNLKNEGLAVDRIRRVGDVMFDASIYYAGLAESSSRILEDLKLDRGNYLLATVHRSENTDDPKRLADIVENIRYASQHFTVVLPLHPRTRGAIARLEPGLSLPSNVKVIDPVGYLDMVMLEKYARLVITDSGGVQKEAFFHKVPCITLREETEWVELVEGGWNILVGTDPARFRHALDTTMNKAAVQWVSNLYGDGNTAVEIARQIVEQPLAG